MSLRLSRIAVAALCVACVGVGCTGGRSPKATSEPRLPEGEAGRVLRRAFDAAGGWERWAALEDVSYVSTLNILDIRRQVSSESIGWFKAPLHRGALARMDSIGLPNEVQFGISGGDTWVFSDGEEILAPRQLSLTRFDMTTNLFWFSLPFLIGELPCATTDLGEERGPEGERWRRIKVVFDAPQPLVPGEWFVLYLDEETWLIDRIHARLTAPFLRQEVWVGKWLRYTDWNGIKKERQRQFFPANLKGEIVGNLVAEQFIEHVRFDNGYPLDYFAKPASSPQRAGARSGRRGPWAG
jgi:hypothetical protein